MSLVLTENAIAKVKHYAKEADSEAIIRVGVKGGGCAGFSHVLFFENENEIEETDNIFEFDGVKVVVDMISMQYLEETKIDYQETMLSSGFKFENAKIKSSCGCGSSFSM